MSNGAQTIWTPQEFPLYYPSESAFQLSNGTPAGVAGATAKLTWEINNFPTILYGVRVVSSYELPTLEFPNDPADPNVYAYTSAIGQVMETLRELDDDILMSIEFAQQNVTAKPSHLRALQGSRGINFHPFPVPYFLRGGNNVTADLRRLSSYPQFPPTTQGGDNQGIFPTAYAVLECGSLVSDAFPGAGPPSTVAQYKAWAMARGASVPETILEQLEEDMRRRRP